METISASLSLIERKSLHSKPQFMLELNGRLLDLDYFFLDKEESHARILDVRCLLPPLWIRWPPPKS
jgi:hypothetical protein